MHTVQGNQVAHLFRKRVMYKKASNNAQHRALSQVINDRANSAGVDPDAFRFNEVENKRAELVERKRELEHSLHKLVTQIKIAQDRHYRGTSGQIAFPVYERMLQQRGNMLGEIADIEKLLHKLKMEKRQLSEPDRMCAAFMHVAKEMLAEPVFNRIAIAALHRAQGKKDKL